MYQSTQAQSINLNIPFSSIQEQSLTHVTDSKLSEAGAVPPTSKATTSMIPSLGEGGSGIFDKYWSDFVDRAHTRHPKLSREQVEYMTPTVDVPNSNNTVDDSPWNEVVARGVVANSKNATDNPPTFTSVEVPKLDVKYDLFDEIMFRDDNTIVSIILVPMTFNLLQKPSSSKPCFDFGTLEGKHGDKTQGDPSEPNDDQNEDEYEKNSESSTSDTGSSNENVVDPFSLFELKIKSFSEVQVAAPSDLDRSN
ncbi:unnamed protein product [Lactuca saligna]|uniref:Uncharacterized protein n=1 Tax=Lactuca saligna TaxID=75948 RepID=A0AA35YT02_LACSI|nr:unnamed protein product [Lactuca saligna]